MNHRIPIALGMAVSWFLVFSGHNTLCGDENRESFRFLRVSGSEFIRETEIHLARTEDKYIVTSMTYRGAQTLTVTSRFDSENQALVSAKVTLKEGKRIQSASVGVVEGTAQATRDGHEPNKLACPSGVIVTSAPDWTDSFMAVRRYDLKGRKTQTFPGLWIHPTREPLKLTIRLTRLGHDSVTHDNKIATLDRFLLVLRGGSRYIVWRNHQGHLVRLVPAMSSDGGIVLSGWKLATRGLKSSVSRDGSNQ